MKDEIIIAGKRYITIARLANELGVTTKCVRDWIRQGKVRYKLLGNTKVFELETILKEQK